MRGEGAAREADRRHGICDICGEENDPALEALVEVECNQRGCKHSPATYHQSCILDVIERNPIGVREKRRCESRPLWLSYLFLLLSALTAERCPLDACIQDVLPAAAAPLRRRRCADEQTPHAACELLQLSAVLFACCAPADCRICTIARRFHLSSWQAPAWRPSLLQVRSAMQKAEVCF